MSKDSERVSRIRRYIRSLREKGPDGRLLYHFSRTIEALGRSAAATDRQRWASWCQRHGYVLKRLRKGVVLFDPETVRQMEAEFESLLQLADEEGKGPGSVAEAGQLESEVPASCAAPATDVLDDLIARLLQLSDGDHDVLEPIRFDILAQARSEGNSPEGRSLAAEAMMKLDEILYGETKDSGSLINEAVELLNQARQSAQQQNATARPEQSTPFSTSEALSDANRGKVESQPASLNSAPRRLSAGQSSSPDDSEPEEVDAFQTSLPPDADPELLEDFLSECQECLDLAEAALLRLESEPHDQESVNTVFRSFHTIKGTSAFLGLSAISILAHQAEELLSDIRDRKIPYQDSVADLSLRALDLMKLLLFEVHGAVQGRAMSKPDGYDSLLSAFRSGTKGWKLGADTSLSETRSSPESGPLEAFSGALEGEGGGNWKEPARNRSPQSSLPLEETSGVETLRVRTDRLDQLIDMVGELVIAQSMVAQDEIVLSVRNQDLARKVAHSGKIVRELQDLSMSLRMVPLQSTFQKMARLIRDLSRRNQKQVRFVSEGEETEIDRHMVEYIRDPLVHLLRNALDHGIEMPEERVAAGKSPQGTVRISAYHSGGNVVVKIQDDGRGLDREKIMHKALERGIVEADNGQPDSEVFGWIFRAGFSTVDQVTEISGRGVGMDVVKKNIEALRGNISVASEKGRGTEVTMALPLTMAITDGMLVRVGQERYIIPISSIQLTFRPAPDQLSSVTGKGEMVMLRGELMPIFRFHRIFAVHGAIEDPTRGLLVVVSDGERRCALLVDELLEQQQVVAKSLGSGIGKVKGISGGAILGDGRVGLILDAPEILELARKRDAQFVNSSIPVSPSSRVTGELSLN